jgi:hypothetical protein
MAHCKLSTIFIHGTLNDIIIWVKKDGRALSAGSKVRAKLFCVKGWIVRAALPKPSSCQLLIHILVQEGLQEYQHELESYFEEQKKTSPSFNKEEADLYSRLLLKALSEVQHMLASRNIFIESLPAGDN